MKKFSFNLETLLRHRKYLEEKERHELSRLFFYIPVGAEPASDH